jgi:uncharacterized protein involved in cysteine biosynthesis
MDYRKMFLAEMIGLSVLLVFLPIPLLSLFIVPLIMAVCGLYYSYLFALASVYLGILLRPGEPATAFVITFLFKLSSLTGISPYLILSLCLGVALPAAIFVVVLLAFKPIKYVTRLVLKGRVRLEYG